MAERFHYFPATRAQLEQALHFAWKQKREETLSLYAAIADVSKTADRLPEYEQYALEDYLRERGVENYSMNETLVSQISNKELCECSGKTQGTISNQVNQLIQGGLVSVAMHGSKGHSTVYLMEPISKNGFDKSCSNNQTQKGLMKPKEGIKPNKNKGLASDGLGLISESLSSAFKRTKSNYPYNPIIHNECEEEAEARTREKNECAPACRRCGCPMSWVDDYEDYRCRKCSENYKWQTR